MEFLCSIERPVLFFNNDLKQDTSPPSSTTSRSKPPLSDHYPLLLPQQTQTMTFNMVQQVSLFYNLASILGISILYRLKFHSLGMLPVFWIGCKQLDFFLCINFVLYLLLWPWYWQCYSSLITGVVIVINSRCFRNPTTILWYSKLCQWCDWCWYPTSYTVQ